jgi:hypothetical protein
LLARLLVAVAKKGAPVADSGKPDDPQKRLDVGSEAKVGSEPETRDMPVQQGFQKGHER